MWNILQLAHWSCSGRLRGSALASIYRFIFWPERIHVVTGMRRMLLFHQLLLQFPKMLDHDHVRQTAQHPKREILQKWYIWFSCGNYGTKLVFLHPDSWWISLPSCYYQPMPSASTPSTLFRHQRLFLRWFPDFRWVDFPQRNFLQVKRGPHPPGSIYLPGARKLARIHFAAKAVSNEKLWGINSSHL